MTDQEMMDAYDKGFECAERGGSKTECPHPHESALGERWILGFDDGGGYD